MGYTQWLSDEVVKEVVDNNPHPMNELGEFVYYRTYSRWLPNDKRREYWHETCRRSTQYNIGLAAKHIKKIGLTVPTKSLKEEAVRFFKSMYNLKQFLSGRTLWVGGAENALAEKYPLGNFNCGYVTVRSWYDLADMFYLLMVGVGVGYKCTPEIAKDLEPVRNNIQLIHSEYKPVPKSERLEHSELHTIGEGYAKIYVGDSKEGWVESLRLYIDVLTKHEYSHVHTLKISYNSVRPRGERLKTFGGTASGHGSLMDMFIGIDNVIQNKIDSTLAPMEAPAPEGYLADPTQTPWRQPRPIHILDVGNLIGHNVVVGGVRRTAEIFLIDAQDWECIWAKYGMNGFYEQKHFDHHEEVRKACKKANIPLPAWFDDLAVQYVTYTKYDANGSYDFATSVEVDKYNSKEIEFLVRHGYVESSEGVHNYGRSLAHRAMSNNSIAYVTKPSREMLHVQFTLLQGEGEPCFVNMEEALRRRPGAEGLNPCVEIILASRGLCNLTTVNIRAFVYFDANGVAQLDLDGLIEAQRMSARAGVRMTLVDLELPEWDKVQKRDGLLGCSVTGWYDAIDALGWDEAKEDMLCELLASVTRETAIDYAYELRIPTPLLDTAVKPEGTLSQVAGGVSSGLHRSQANWYFRRIRINATDKLAQVALSLGWDVKAENFTEGATEEERLANAKTWVVKFPVKSDCKRTKFDVTVKEQFDTYFRFQEKYTAHNSSNTITVKPGEWEEAEQIVWDKWDSFVGVSFLALDGGTYQQAPYETCTEEQYNELVASMPRFNVEMLQAIETDYEEEALIDDNCVGGACPIR